jgi:hypothetical protein
VLESAGENFIINLPVTQFQSQETFINLLKKSRSTGSLPDKKPARKYNVLMEEKLDEMGDRLEHKTQKSLKHLA